MLFPKKLNKASGTISGESNREEKSMNCCNEERQRQRERRENSCLLFITSEAFANNFTLKGTSLFDSKVFVILGKPSLALLVYHQYESDPHFQQTSKHLLEFFWVQWLANGVVKDQEKGKYQKTPL